MSTLISLNTNHVTTLVFLNFKCMGVTTGCVGVLFLVFTPEKIKIIKREAEMVYNQLHLV